VNLIALVENVIDRQLHIAEHHFANNREQAEKLLIQIPYRKQLWRDYQLYEWRPVLYRL